MNFACRYKVPNALTLCEHHNNIAKTHSGVFGNMLKRVQASKVVQLLTQQRQDTLWQLIGLRHHGSACLLQDLRATQIGGFLCKVSILNTAASSTHVLRSSLKVRHCGIKAGLQSAICSALVIHCRNSSIYSCQSPSC